MLQNSFSGSVIQAEIISGVQNMDNIILIFPAYRIKGVTVLSDDPFPFLIGVFHIEDNHISSVCTDLICRSIIQVKNILDHLAFFLLDAALFISLCKQHTDFFLCGLLLFFFRFDPHQIQHTIGSYCQKCSSRPDCDHRDLKKPCQTQRQLIRIFHSQTSWHQFSEQKTYIGKQYGHNDHAYDLQNILWYIYSCPYQCCCHRLCKIFCRKSALQKSCRSYRYTDRCHKMCRLFCELYQNLRPVISLFRQLPHLCFIHGQNRHFRTCENRVQKDQEYQ